MTASRPRFSFIERLAERLLAEHGVTRAPVPVEDLARKAGCRIIAAPLHDVSGLLVRSPDGATIAHELGHLLLHRGEQVTYDHAFRVNLRSVESSEGTDVEEIEANFFASRLLMPEAFLQAGPRTTSIDMEDDATVAALAKEYKVSQQAMTLRLARLGGRRA